MLANGQSISKIWGNSYLRDMSSIYRLSPGETAYFGWNYFYEGLPGPQGARDVEFASDRARRMKYWE